MMEGTLGFQIVRVGILSVVAEFVGMGYSQGECVGFTKVKLTRGQKTCKERTSYHSLVLILKGSRFLRICQVTCATNITESYSICIGNGSFAGSDFTPETQFRDIRQRIPQKRC